MLKVHDQVHLPMAHDAASQDNAMAHGVMMAIGLKPADAAALLKLLEVCSHGRADDVLAKH